MRVSLFIYLLAAQLFYAFFCIPDISQKMFKKEYTLSEIVKILFMYEKTIRKYINIVTLMIPVGIIIFFFIVFIESLKLLYVGF